MDEWDLLWSPSGSALKAAEHMRPGQLLCTLPGMFSITKKRRLPMTLQVGHSGGAQCAALPSLPLKTTAVPSRRGSMWRCMML
jgi:hypothetical protein